ncbi:MAG: thioredoxin domain-containing protein [Candidatus Krumholzibacteriia bacterium]
MGRIAALVFIVHLAGFSMAAANPRTPSYLREHGNHLKGEPSLYLRQHAHNPVDWYPWGDEALAAARDGDKPIFLSIGYSSCHWCHVMEHEVFEQDDVAVFMNRHFVSVKVDREERPDLDAVYMDAVQMMTGRGGWPMSVFLTPDLQPFYGGTYFPKPQFLQLVQRIVDVYRSQRGELEKQAAQLAAEIARRGDLGQGGGGDLARGLVAGAVAKAKEQHDATWHGFRQQQKFPTPIKWRWLLHEWRRQGDPELAAMITGTLDAMQAGGLQDHVGGGFHRYCTDPAWTVPHFEKMLYDNGQLAGLYLEAGAIMDRADWTATGLDVLDFLLREMRDPRGAFYASWDADSGGEEGTFYVWDRTQLVAATGPDDGPVLADLLGVDDEGNFEQTGRSVLTRRTDPAAVAVRHGRDEDEVRGLFARHRETLRRARAERTPPGLDRKVVASWNGLVLEALARAAALTGQARWREAADRAADHLLAVHRQDDGTLWRTSEDGRTAGRGVLDDYAFLAAGLLELYQVSGEPRRLAQARELADLARTRFARAGGGWYLADDATGAPLGRTVEFFDSVEPSGGAAMVNLLLDLEALTGEATYRDEARRALDACGRLLADAGPEMAWWLEGAGKLLWPHRAVVIAGTPGAPDTEALRTACLGLPAPGAVLATVPAAGPDAALAALAPALAGKTALDGKATAYVCEFGACRAPVTDPDELREQLQEGWER